MAPVLVDLSCLCAHHTDEALEFIYKSGSEPTGDDMWAEHPSPLIRRLVEMFTQRGLARTSGMKIELEKWLAGGMHRGSAVSPRPLGAMARWSAAELAMVRLYLETLPAPSFTLDDWMMVVDYVVQRYLPAEDLRAEGDWLATRSALMGRVEAAIGDATVETADKMLQAMPATAATAERELGLNAIQRAVIEYGNARCAENVVGLTDTLRHRLRSAIVDYQESEFLGAAGAARPALQTRLADAFGQMNRDWRRIAVTEATNNLGNGLIASLPAGTKVKRVEKYRGACAFCRSIDGRILEVVESDAPEKNAETLVWAGKSNIGRSAAPRKRVGSELVEREPHEMWQIPAGTVHPNCRGTWIVLEQGSRPVDAKFSAWMDKVLGR